MTKTLYQILNVPESATDLEIHSAFKNLEQALAGLHDSESIHRLNSVRVAFSKLSDPAARIAYDQKLANSRIPPELPKRNPANTLTAIAAMLTAVAVCALLVYADIESKRIEQAESSHQAEQAAQLLAAREKAKQAEFDRQIQLKSAEQSVELERERLEMETKLHRQVNENRQDFAEQQLDFQGRQIAQELELQKKYSDMDLNRQEMELTEKKLDFQSHKASLAMQMKQQAAQNALQAEQRALQQREMNLQSIRDLQAARLRDYDRNHYGTGGEISVFNAEINR